MNDPSNASSHFIPIPFPFHPMLDEPFSPPLPRRGGPMLLNSLRIKSKPAPGIATPSHGICLRFHKCDIQSPPPGKEAQEKNRRIRPVQKYNINSPSVKKKKKSVMGIESTCSRSKVMNGPEIGGRRYMCKEEALQEM